MEYFVGIDLGWKLDNRSFTVILDNHAGIIHQEYLALMEIKPFLDSTIDAQKAIISIDAPLIVHNETGNRMAEVEFLREYGRYKLGVYPINRNLLLKSYGAIVGEEISRSMPNYKLVEVYPHATILNLFNNGKVLPYKYKKGRNKAFYIEQLQIYSQFLHRVVERINESLWDSSTLKTLKYYEDYLDSIACAYTLYHAKHFGYKSFGNENEGLLIVPTLQHKLCYEAVCNGCNLDE
ncbi:MAG: hypothetical protein KU38_08880 [Sulfurovum sp. FS08-3]|nr:MAG: hypothetical protein KU38_08880 [Sulfurovum sp. FS08-3]